MGVLDRLEKVLLAGADTGGTAAAMPDSTTPDCKFLQWDFLNPNAWEVRDDQVALDPHEKGLLLTTNGKGYNYQISAFVPVISANRPCACVVSVEFEGCGSLRLGVTPTDQSTFIELKEVTGAGIITTLLLFTIPLRHRAGLYLILSNNQAPIQKVRILDAAVCYLPRELSSSTQELCVRTLFEQRCALRIKRAAIEDRRRSFEARQRELIQEHLSTLEKERERYHGITGEAVKAGLDAKAHEDRLRAEIARQSGILQTHLSTLEKEVERIHALAKETTKGLTDALHVDIERQHEMLHSHMTALGQEAERMRSFSAEMAKAGVDTRATVDDFRKLFDEQREQTQAQMLTLQQESERFRSFTAEMGKVCSETRALEQAIHEDFERNAGRVQDIVMTTGRTLQETEAARKKERRFLIVMQTLVLAMFCLNAVLWIWMLLRS